MRPVPVIPNDISALLDSLLSQMRAILPEKLVGLYLYGSLVTGDFDGDISDIDLLAAITDDLSEAEFAALDQMHNAFVRERPNWDDRLEIAYLSLHALKTFRTEASAIGIISPGEPFHLKEAGKDWLVNWYTVREKGLVIFGPLAAAIIDPIAKEEFLQTVRAHLISWHEWINDMRQRPAQAYAILTMCRGLYTLTNGEQVSKKQAALWAADQLPEWSTLIHTALLWRKAWRETGIDHESTFVETRRFVDFIIDRVSQNASQ